jgi:hypothetical protein
MREALQRYGSLQSALCTAPKATLAAGEAAARRRQTLASPPQGFEGAAAVPSRHGAQHPEKRGRLRALAVEPDDRVRRSMDWVMPSRVGAQRGLASIIFFFQSNT